ncbi:unnamed protein product [Phytophthora lilii]|uniref:Unnamed protein product n=1 Tax=Phytophthora lilii TaxID=2077276 RepID=A0A9W6X843_9STRA|nr:unnamed protein product [Phytophthora lilii]
MRTVSERSLRTSSNLAPVDNSKVDDFRRQSLARDEQEEQEDHDPRKLLQEDKRGWSFFMQRNSVLRTYQKRLVFNTDIKVAGLEFTIMFLSLVQLHWSYHNPHWVSFTEKYL